jgi:hypothetical protein
LPPEGPGEEGAELEMAGAEEAIGLDAATEVAKVVIAWAEEEPKLPYETDEKAAADDFWKKPAGDTESEEVAAGDGWKACTFPPAAEIVLVPLEMVMVT